MRPGIAKKKKHTRPPLSMASFEGGGKSKQLFSREAFKCSSESDSESDVALYSDRDINIFTTRNLTFS